MPGIEGNGQRRNEKTRGQRNTARRAELGYYIIVTDTEATERSYFEGLRKSLPENIRRKLIIHVVDTDTKNLVRKSQELAAYNPQYAVPWIVFDHDRVDDFDKIIEKAEKSGISVGWSNPCIEIWFQAYFGHMPTTEDSKVCCRNFREMFQHKTGQDYSKADPDIYRKLSKYGDEMAAIELAASRYRQFSNGGRAAPSEMPSCTTVHTLVAEIREKAAGT